MRRARVLRPVLVALLVGLVGAGALGGCGAASDTVVGETAVIAAEAEVWMDALAVVEDAGTSGQAIFYDEDAVHDFVMVGGPEFYQEGRLDVVEMQMGSAEADLIRGPLFLDVDAVVRVFTLDYPASWGPDNSGPMASLTHLVIGEHGIDRLTHMRGTWYADRSTWWGTTDQGRVAGQLADRIAADYVQVWSTGDPGLVGELYVDGAVVDDRVRRVTAEGRAAVAELAEQSAAPVGLVPLAEMVPASVVDSDPFPEPSTPTVFFDMDPDPRGRLSEVWLPVRSQADCPGAAIVALTVDQQQRVLAERRYPALGSLRACDDPDDLAEGWWTGRDLPLPFGERVTGVFESEAGPVEIRNGSAGTDALVGWAFNRFAMAGLPAPAVSAIRFDPFDERCEDARGYATWTDGITEILICFDSAAIGPPQPVDLDDPAEDAEEARTPPRAHLLLHELGHAWIVSHTDQATRDAVTAHVGASSWNDKRDPWEDRGVEWAAETLAWGLIDPPGTSLNLGNPPCSLMDSTFGILTGTEPLTDDPPTLRDPT